MHRLPMHLAMQNGMDPSIDKHGTRRRSPDHSTVEIPSPKIDREVVELRYGNPIRIKLLTLKR